MKFVVDPEILLEVVRSHLDLPRDGMPAAITQDLAKGSPGRIETEPESFFSNAGGVMGQVAVLYASLREYVIFFGTPIGGGGHTGRHPFADDYVVILDGEMWYYGEGDTQREEYHPGDSVHLPRGQSRGLRIVERGWILEYARGAIPTMLPFAVADALSSTLDFSSLLRTFWIYAKHVVRSMR